MDIYTECQGLRSLAAQIVAESNQQKVATRIPLPANDAKLKFNPPQPCHICVDKFNPLHRRKFADSKALRQHILFK